MSWKVFIFLLWRYIRTPFRAKRVYSSVSSSSMNMSFILKVSLIPFSMVIPSLITLSLDITGLLSQGYLEFMYNYGQDSLCAVLAVLFYLHLKNKKVIFSLNQKIVELQLIGVYYLLLSKHFF
jgi:hypothetical protein